MRGIALSSLLSCRLLANLNSRGSPVAPTWAHLCPPVLTRKQKRPRVNSLVCDRAAAFCAAGPPEVLSRMSRPVTQVAERERELARARNQRLKQAAPSLPGESVSRGFADRGALEGYPSHYTSLIVVPSVISTVQGGNITEKTKSTVTFIRDWRVLNQEYRNLWVPSYHCGDVVPGRVLPLCWVIWMCRCFDPLFWHSGDWSRSFWGTFSHPLTPKWSFGVLKLPILTEFDLFGPKFRFSLNLFGSNFQRPVVHPHQFSDWVAPRGCSYLGPSGFGGPAGSRVVTVTQEAPQANPNMPNLLLSTVWIFRRIIQRIIRQNFQQFHGGCY